VPGAGRRSPNARNVERNPSPTPVVGKKLADWALAPCRDDLGAEISTLVDQTREPKWMRRAIERTGASSLVAAADQLVAEALHASNAVDPNPPPVRLSRICSWLGVQLRFVREEELRRYRPTPRGPEARVTRWAAGSLSAVGRMQWLLVAGSRSDSYTRQSVAHELGHALIFRSEAGIDLSAWRTAGWSKAEEQIVNYMARSLLIPSPLLEVPSSGRNLAEWVVEVAGRYATPHRLSAVRLLDLEVPGPARPRAVVLWRQYHPFSDYFVERVFGRDTRLCKWMRQMARKLRELFRDATVPRAVAIWGNVLEIHPPEHLGLRLELGDEAAVHAHLPERRQFAGAIEPERAERFLNPLAHFHYRPEWVVWRGRPSDSYVPLRRGASRRGSLVADLAARGKTEGLERLERVDLGDLTGSFLVHGFAHGDALEGSRFVLSVLSERG